MSAALLAAMFLAAAPPAEPVFMRSADPPTDLAGTWACIDGDDPAFASPATDDSTWVRVELPEVDRTKSCGAARTWLRRRIHVDERLREDPLGIAVGVPRGAFELYLDGVRAGAHGSVEPFEEGLRTGSTFPVPAAALADGELLVAIRIANHPDVIQVDSGWRLVPSGPLLIGRMPSTGGIVRDEVERVVRDETSASIGISALFLFVALYHVLVWAMRRDQRGYLWFGVLAMVANTWMVIGALAGTTHLPISSYAACSIGNGFVGTWVSIAFIQFFHWFLERRAPTRPWRLLQALYIVLSLIGFIPGFGLRLTIHPLVIVAKTAVLVMSVAVFVRAARRGSREGRVLLVGFGMLVLGAPLEVLVLSRGVKLPVNPAQMGFLFFVITMAIALVAQFTRTLGEVDARNAELEETNRSIARFVPYGFLHALERRSVREVVRGDNRMREMAVLFCDLRGFTTLAEAMGPDATFRFINAYLARMEPEVHRGGGFINQYLGDGILALFPGANAGCDDAVSAALGMVKALEALNAERQRRREAPLRIGIGIHAGPLMIGTIGGGDQIDAGVIGDAVNAAARIEGMSKIYGATILVSEVVARRLQLTGVTLRQIDVVRAKGRQAPMPIFEVLDACPHGAAKRETVALFKEARELYAMGRFQAARGQFARCVERVPGDEAAALLLRRCADLEINHPERWSGVYALQQK